jgi:hypothetical protein
MTGPRTVWKWILAIVAIIAVAQIVVGRKHWAGFVSYPIQRVGTFGDLNACRVEVEKVGGWCGKDCKSYGGGLYADCTPLVHVERIK